MKMLLLLLFSFITVGYTSKILIPIATCKSHLMYVGHMAKALASRGHDVTIAVGDGIVNMSEVNSIHNKWLKYKTHETPFLDTPENSPSLDDLQLASLRGLKTMAALNSVINNECLQMFDDSEFMKQVYKSNFDFAIVVPVYKSNFLLPYRLGIPYAILSPDFIIDYNNMRIPAYPSYMPLAMTEYSDHMSFFQRLVNFVASNALDAVGLQLWGDDDGIKDTAKYAPDRPPVTYVTLQQQASLLFTLRAPGFHYVRGSLPNMLDVGGIMARPANLSNIQPDLRSTVDKATNGFIMVSFGSWLRQPEETIQKFIRAFEATNLTIIWKLKDAPPNLPSNVNTVTWLPQNDLLGHPNIRAFITHCGGSSTLETLYNGVPAIAVPLAVDQQSNAALLKTRQLGIVINMKNFELSELKSAIEQVTSPGNVYAANMARLSAVCNAMPDAGKTASFWIDHVIKHGDSHLRAAAYDLEKYQYLNIDVIALILLILLLMSFIVILCLRRICRYVCKCKIKQD